MHILYLSMMKRSRMCFETAKTHSHPATDFLEGVLLTSQRTGQTNWGCTCLTRSPAASASALAFQQTSSKRPLRELASTKQKQKQKHTHTHKQVRKRFFLQPTNFLCTTKPRPSPATREPASPSAVTTARPKTKTTRRKRRAASVLNKRDTAGRTRGIRYSRH